MFPCGDIFLCSLKLASYKLLGKNLINKIKQLIKLYNKLCYKTI